MKLAHILALIVFCLMVVFSGGDYAKGVEAGASWGYWISMIFGIIMGIILIVSMLFGGAMGASVGRALGGLLGTLSAGMAVLVLCFFVIANIFLAVAGYEILGAWGASGLEDNALLIKGGVCLGVSYVLSFLRRWLK